MPNLPGVNHQDAVRAFRKIGWRVIRQGKHIVMSNGEDHIAIPRHNPVNGFTMAGIVLSAGLKLDEFRRLLRSRLILLRCNYLLRSIVKPTLTVTW